MRSDQLEPPRRHSVAPRIQCVCQFDRAVALVEQHAAAIGLDMATFTGYSIRAGFATTAKRIGPDERRLDGSGARREAGCSRIR